MMGKGPLFHVTKPDVSQSRPETESAAPKRRLGASSPSSNPLATNAIPQARLQSAGTGEVDQAGQKQMTPNNVATAMAGMMDEPRNSFEPDSWPGCGIPTGEEGMANVVSFGCLQMKAVALHAAHVTWVSLFQATVGGLPAAIVRHEFAIIKEENGKK